MHPALLLLLIGLVYILLFGGLSLLRREGLSLRFALESLVVTLIAAAGAWMGMTIQPLFFLVLLYLITMRGRVLVEVANILARRGAYQAADRLYGLALRLWPDTATRFITDINRATSLIKRGNADAAIALLTTVLDEGESGYLGLKYEAAAHYNLGIAYFRKEMNSRAVVELNAAIDVWPASQYARFAQVVLKKYRQQQQRPPG